MHERSFLEEIVAAVAAAGLPHRLSNGYATLRSTQKHGLGSDWDSVMRPAVVRSHAARTLEVRKRVYQPVFKNPNLSA